MPKEVKVPLTSPIITHEGPTHELILREPRGREYIAMGAPYERVPTDNGRSTMMKRQDLLARYMDILVIKPDAELLGQLSLPDAIRVEDEIIDFFLQAERTAFSPPPASSSSTSASSAQASAPS